MKYTIKKLAELAGVSTRTLRYYDQIDLLKPDEINSSNYRIYTEKNVNKLQQIMFYRALGFSLKKIKQLMNDPNFSEIEALNEQRKLLLARQAQINNLLTNLENTIKDYQGVTNMTDSEKFQAFKENQIKNNEQQYGAEIRNKYGEDNVDQVNTKYGQLEEQEFKQMTNLEKQMIFDLVELKKNPDLKSSLAEKIYQEHRDWLKYMWPKYNKQAHRGLVDMYINDDRFTKYYDQKAQVPVVKLLHDVIYQYTK
ncbi:MerR family transcriptional regulator [Companilactobacillus musae]|uniref:MerR family transcriptional regulator n=1 Tax=Companilactobacillus musae TaxID=1903258 RepID=UPI000E64F1AE|nr:MerR family transcriptional regulator [Companilactobacillus musae]